MAITTRRGDITLSDLMRPMAIPLSTLLLGGALLSVRGSRLLDLVALVVIGAGFLAIDMATIKRTLLAIALIELPLQIDVYIGHDEAVGSIGTISGFNVSITTFVLILLYGLWLAEALSERRFLHRAQRRALLPAVSYFVATALSVAVAQSPVVAMYEIVIIFQALLILVYVVHFVRTRRDLLFVMSLTVIGLLLQAFIGLIIEQLGSFSFGAFAGGITDFRVAGTLGSPNVLGAYLALVLGPALGLALSTSHRSIRLLGGSAFLVGALTLLLTQSRGAWVGFGASLAVAVVIAYRKGWLGTKHLVLIGLPFALVIAFQAGDIIGRLGDFSNPAAQARIPLMELAFRMIADTPLLGVGANNFATALGDYLTVEYSRTWIFTVHNKYLLVWAEAGVVALATFLWFLTSALRRGWRVVRDGDPLLAPIALGLLAGVASNMLHMLVDIFNGRPQTHALWLSVGLIIALEALTRRPSLGQTTTVGPASAP